jgi:predicted dehydrogenase
LLAVDFSYRYIQGAARLRRLIQSGSLGKLFSIDLVFHNAYGPDKAWFYDVRESGGGCVIDLATHLIDLALWMCGDPAASQLSSRLYRAGRTVLDSSEVEDTGFAQWVFDDDILVRLACSWRFSAGCDAEIRAAFVGSEGAAVLRNTNGSFYDFLAERYCGTQRTQLASPPDDWGGRALARWAARLVIDPSFDPDIERCLLVANLVDSIYGR